ncbi:class I SAM-dependent methyltransferase [Bacillus sp. Marseille-P3661]|uniref:class I SAM-dependent methyltransferase n=1 Tax=Bacillus sp. Marseille-P3661 TaxID=1936234 RepID=UPI000C83EE90|nr:class I SAM-dependent methyltransferase [Bacillus sp. Marseille-P3661]
MGREFIGLFDEWAESYDETVDGHNIEYKEVFDGYDQILDTVAASVSGTIVEFGVGTGNLSKLLMEKGNKVIGVEPSKEMRAIAKQKLPNLDIHDGDFLSLPVISEQVDGIVSTYAFHHLTDSEKNIAIKKYSDLLQPGGKIVFADTAYENENAKHAIIEDAEQKGYNNLVHDLNTEYYTFLDVLDKLFTQNRFSVSFKQLNKFVWLIEATKQ